MVPPFLENIMLKITDKALRELNKFFEGREVKTMRVSLASGGCSAPELVLTEDEAKEDDTVIELAPFTFCVNTSLLEESQGMEIDVSYMGFTIEPKKHFVKSPDCGMCATGCS